MLYLAYMKIPKKLAFTADSPVLTPEKLRELNAALDTVTNGVAIAAADMQEMNKRITATTQRMGDAMRAVFASRG